MRDDHGGATVVMLALVAVLAVAAVAVTSLGLLYAARAQAQNAADAGALAAAVATYPPAGGGEPMTRARSVVADNGGVLVACRCSVDSSLEPRTVEVVAVVVTTVPVFGEVRVRGAGRAEFDPLRWLGL